MDTPAPSSRKPWILIVLAIIMGSIAAPYILSGVGLKSQLLTVTSAQLHVSVSGSMLQSIQSGSAVATSTDQHTASLTLGQNELAGDTIEGFISVAPGAELGTLDMALEGEDLDPSLYEIVFSICGNRVRELSEACDDADGIGEHQSCTDQCTITTLAYCGDEVKNAEEQCDGSDGIGAHQSCDPNTCTLVNLPYCGDEIVNQPSEQCDSKDPTKCTVQCKLPVMKSVPVGNGGTIRFEIRRKQPQQ